jgi:hypothetical protein
VKRISPKDLTPRPIDRDVSGGFAEQRPERIEEQRRREAEAEKAKRRGARRDGRDT